MNNSIRSWLGRRRNFLIGVSFTIRKLLKRDDFLTFQCNLCGNTCTSPIHSVTGRETRSCYYCGSTLRFRSIIDILSNALFGEGLILKDFPVNTGISGIGMSDSPLYADVLKTKLDYLNTFYLL